MSPGASDPIRKWWTLAMDAAALWTALTIAVVAASQFATPGTKLESVAIAAPPSSTVRIELTASGDLELTGPRGVRSSRPGPTFDAGLAAVVRGARIAVAVQGGGALEVGRLSSPEVTLDARAIHVRGALTSGRVRLRARELLTVETRGEIRASRIELSGAVVMNTGVVSADGADGGLVRIRARNVMNQGQLRARAVSVPGGAGGRVQIDYERFYVESARASIDVSGGARGGAIAVTGARDSNLFGSGMDAARGRIGGQITLNASDMELVVARLDASGRNAGGEIRIGGEIRDGKRVALTRTVSVRAGSELRARSEANGDGGRVLLASLEQTAFAGIAEVQGGERGGNGGIVDVSSSGSVLFRGRVQAEARTGRPGRLMLDPKNITISNTVSKLLQLELIDPTPTTGDQFGTIALSLSTGNVVITDPYDDFGAVDAGAVHLFDGTTGALISTLTGSTANDHVGLTGVTPLKNGNYVVRTSSWDNGATSDAGAVTWGDGNIGVAGMVGLSNSLVGSSPGDFVGSNTVTALANGNYVVASASWTNGSTAHVGAATWGNGTTGIVGVVSIANSLVGSTTTDYVGGSVVALTNGNYVVGSPSWSNAAGAATWGNGSTGTMGTVSIANSLVGSSAGDGVGGSAIGPGEANITALSNGNYLVNCPAWDNGASTNAGAVTWGNGSTGTSGAITAANSLVGTNASDSVGYNVWVLTNGNYVVGSQLWSNGSVAAAGAATWGNGSTGTSGAVSGANSIVGSTIQDEVGFAVTPLSNGNYVAATPYWHDAGGASVGAVTWATGASATSAVVAPSNSLTGSSNSDKVGWLVTALSNGNYVVQSPYWQSAGIAIGAVTWESGTAGTSDVVSPTNSLIGSISGDQVGIGLAALTNGNYVVGSSQWDNGTVVDAGAATWSNGSGPTVGVVSLSNSLVGSSASARVGSVLPLTNGNYVTGENGAALTKWVDGATGVVGTMTGSNSLSGGYTATPLSGGNYVVASTTGSGAVIGVDGTVGVTGTMTAANSLIPPTTAQSSAFGADGPVPGTFVGSFPKSGSGHVYVGAITLDALQPDYAWQPDATVTIPPSMLVSTLDRGIDVSLEASNDITIASDVIANNPTGTTGALTLGGGRSVVVNAKLVTDGSAVTLIANDLLANGVADSERDAGPGGISWATGVVVDTGGGPVRLSVRSGAGKTNSTSGDLQVGTLTASTVFAQAEGGSLQLNGKITSSASGDAIVLVSDVFLVATTAPADTLTAAGGRYLLYAPSPDAATVGAIPLSFQEFGKTYPATPDPAHTGSGILYASGGTATSPLVTVEQAGTDPTTADTITFTVTFDQSCDGFDPTDVDLGLSTASGPLVAAVTGGPLVYEISVTGMSSSGVVIARIGAGACTGTNGALPNQASTSIDDVVSWSPAGGGTGGTGGVGTAGTAGTSTAGSAGTPPAAGTGGTAGSAANTGGTPASTGGSAGTAGGGTAPAASSDQGCSCSTPRGHTNATGLAGALIVLLLARTRRPARTGHSQRSRRREDD